LHAVNKKKPQFFEVGTERVRLKENDGKVWHEPFDVDGIWAELGTHIRWVKGEEERVVKPDADVAKMIANRANLWFPRLDGFVNSPFFAADGELISTPGYHPASKTYYSPPTDFELPEIPEEPTKKDVKDAVDMIMDNVFIDFPWSDGDDGFGYGSRAHAFALTLQPFMRPMINGPTPIYATQKPAAGSGGSLLISTVTHIFMGGTGVATQTEKGSEEETRKAITSALMTGAAAIFWDNLNNHFHGAAFANLATCDAWTDRLLGTNKTVSVPARAAVIVAGNNIASSTEIARRMLPIMLDAKRDPTARTGFKHDLKEWVPEHRAELVAACLTIIRNWVNLGKPLWGGKPLPSFESYSKVMGGVLEAAGVKGFMSNLHIAKKVAQSETAPWAAFVGAWFSAYGSTPRKIGNPFDAGNGGVWDGDKSLVHLIEEKGIGITIKGEPGIAQAVSLGKQMEHRRGSVYNVDGRELRLCCSERKVDDSWLWSVEEVVIDPWELAAEGIFADAPEDGWDPRDELAA
jgi:hypothetical protein